MKNLDSISSNVRLRGGFADRHGLASENHAIQINDLDERSRVALVNTLGNLWQAIYGEYTKRGSRIGEWDNFLRGILSNVYVRILDYTKRPDHEETVRLLQHTILREHYAPVFSMLEFVAKELQKLLEAVVYNSNGLVYEALNGVFERELVGYRFVDCLITPITDETELNEIKQAITNTDTNALDSVYTRIVI